MVLIPDESVLENDFHMVGLETLVCLTTHGSSVFYVDKSY